MIYRMSINQIVEAAHENAVEKGFYDDIEAMTGFLSGQRQQALCAAAKRDFALAQLAKIMSEGGEAVAEVQKRGVHAESFGEELADIVIRVCDLAGYLDINLGKAIHQKMEKNKTRPRLHGKFC